jgi:hypothetical protein
MAAHRKSNQRRVYPCVVALRKRALGGTQICNLQSVANGMLLLLTQFRKYSPIVTHPCYTAQSDALCNLLISSGWTAGDSDSLPHRAVDSEVFMFRASKNITDRHDKSVEIQPRSPVSAHVTANRSQNGFVHKLQVLIPHRTISFVATESDITFRHDAQTAISAPHCPPAPAFDAHGGSGTAAEDSERFSGLVPDFSGTVALESLLTAGRQMMRP